MIDSIIGRIFEKEGQNVKRKKRTTSTQKKEMRKKKHE